MAAKSKPVPPVNQEASKAGDFANYAEAAGWDVERQVNGDIKTVIARRGDEQINASWRNNAAFDKWYHTFPGGHVSLKNSAHAKRIVDMKPGEAAASAPVRRPRKAAGEKRGPVRVKVNFNPASSTDEEVMLALLGHRLTWKNQYTDGSESALLAINGKLTRLDPSDDPVDRQLTFCDAEGGGFRTVRLRDIITVSPKAIDDGHTLRLTHDKAMNAMREGRKSA